MTVDRISQEPREDIPPFDLPRAEAAVRELLIAVGEDPEREGLRETPARVARAYQSCSSGCGRTRRRCSPPPSTWATTR